MNNVKNLAGAVTVALLTLSCTMNNPLLTESPLPYGAPQFDKIRPSHYLPAFKAAIAEGKSEIDAIVACPEAASFENTIEALEYAGQTFNRVSGIFYNILEADTSDELQDIAETLAPLTNDFSMYISLNGPLFERVRAVWEQRDDLFLDGDRKMLLEKTWKSFRRGGACLSPEDKEKYSDLSNRLSLATLKFGKNVLAATNAFTLNVTDSSKLAGMPAYLLEQAAQTAAEKGDNGWTFDLSYPSYGPFMRFCASRELREQMARAYGSRAVGGEFDNTETVREIVSLRQQIALLLGYSDYAEYALEERMASNPQTVRDFLAELLEPSLPAALRDVQEVFEYAKEHGFEGDELMSWDFPFWSERYREAEYSLSEDLLKPYFRLENCIPAVFDLAGRLYGLTFEECPDIPVYHPDVKVYDVKDADGRHLALFYADFFPRASKRAGAWMTEFRGQSIKDGVERRPLVSIVTNFSKPTASSPSLLTHDELTTFLHEFGHSLHGMMAEGRYESLSGTNVPLDFVELPSQIMENWAFEPEYLSTFARHYQTGEVLPESLIGKIVESKNYLAAYSQVRQLQYGILDMAWYGNAELPEEDAVTFEKKVLAPSSVLPPTDGCATSESFSHIFAGGYSAGYYAYKWAEVLEADAFSLFQEKGIFSREVSGSFRENILSRGSSEDVNVLYRRFRGHSPQPEALLRKLGII